MKISTIAVKNIRRRKTKMALLVIGLMIAIASLVSITTLMSSFRDKIDAQLGKYGFNILIFPKSSDLSLTYGGMTISGVSSYKAKYLGSAEISKINSIRKSFTMYISPKYLKGVVIKNVPALFVGIEPKEELSVKSWWRGESSLNNSNVHNHSHGDSKDEKTVKSIKEILAKEPLAKNDLIVGSSACKKLNLKPGDVIKINGADFRVRIALADTGSQDDDLIFGDLSNGQELFGSSGNVNLVEIATDNTEDINIIVEKLSKLLPNASVSSVVQAVKYKETAINRLSRFGLTVSGIIIFISAMIVFATMTSSVTERTREIGIFRAIGYRKSKITKIIMIEAAILSFIGGLLGYILGFGIASLLAAVVKSINVNVGINLNFLAASVMISMFIGIISTIFPAYKAANLNPAIALKEL